MHLRTKLLYLVMSVHFFGGLTLKYKSIVSCFLNLPQGAKGDIWRLTLAVASSSSPSVLRFFDFLLLSLSSGLTTSILNGHSARLSSGSCLGLLRAEEAMTTRLCVFCGVFR